MDSVSRPFAASATGSHDDVFLRARLKLTLHYLAVIAVILALFSAALYFNVSSEVREALRRAPELGLDSDAFFDEQAGDLLWTILLADGVILAVSAATSYAFAGLTLRPIRAALDVQERFAADAAHDLRTPLAVMRTEIEVLLRGKEIVSPRTRRTLESVVEESKRLAGITEDLLLAARDQEFLNVRPSLGNVELRSLVTTVADSLRSVAESRRARIVVEDGMPARTLATEDGLRRAVANVVENAIKHGADGGTVSVSIDAAELGWIYVRVRDTGAGISPENLPRIFDRFYKADNARHGAGSGLGLSIVKRTVESYGGTVSATSELGRGTTVAIRLRASS